VAVSLDQRIAAIATDQDVLSQDALYKEILDTVESVGFGAEVYTGSRDITIQVTRAAAATQSKSNSKMTSNTANDEKETLLDQDKEGTSATDMMSNEILSPLRSLSGVACVQLKAGQSLNGTGTGTHPLEIVVRGTLTYEELIASTNLDGWDIKLTSVAYDNQYRSGESRVYESTTSADVSNILSMKRGAALLMEEMSVVSDILQPQGGGGGAGAGRVRGYVWLPPPQ
jgi:hypothetical protein